MACINLVEPLRTRADIAKMKRILQTRSARDYALFVLAINTGFRIGDLLALTVGDVLAGAGARLRIAPRVMVREQKTHKKRIAILNAPARKALKQYLSTRARRFPEDPLFISRNRDKSGSYRAISRAQAWRRLSDAARACGIVSFGTHSMRKTFGYFHYKAGQPLEEIQKILNHSSPAVTLCYIGITQEKLEQSYNDIEL